MPIYLHISIRMQMHKRLKGNPRLLTAALLSGIRAGEKGRHLYLFRIFPDCLHVFTVHVSDLDNFKDPVKASGTKPNPNNINRRAKMPQGCFWRQLVAGKSRGFLVSHVISLRLGFLLCKMGPVLMQSPES